MNLLGISCFYHDSAASVFIDGKLVAASEEERFSRIKHDKNFPINSIDFCLSFSNIDISSIDAIIYYDKPILKLERIFESLLFYSPMGFSQFSEFIKEWLVNGKWNTQKLIKTELLKKYPGSKIPQIIFEEHHRSHAASAFFPSPYEEALIICLDGVGEWTTSSIWYGKGSNIELKKQINFPHSLGLLYSAFTYYLGFKVNDGEYKLMGLAPYGEPIYKDLILKELIDVKEDGSFCLNMEYFTYTSKLVPFNSKFEKLFSHSRKIDNEPHNLYHANIAASIQSVTEEVILKIIKFSVNEYGIKNICLAGGVAQNCVANEKILESSLVDSIWVQPASGDSGGAIGACYSHLASLNLLKRDFTDQMSGSLLGPQFEIDEIQSSLDRLGATYKKINETEISNLVCNDLINQKIIGWFQGRAEFGPRALGNRSILADPRNPEIQKILNLKIKYRESFRPFAPAILEDQFENYFNSVHRTPYMSVTYKIKEKFRTSNQIDKSDIYSMLNTKKSLFPGITHIDYSARVQSVFNNINPKFYKLINDFFTKTTCPMLINTSFNIRGEPIVSSIEDAYKCFMNTEIDVLVIENFYLLKTDQKLNKNFLYKTEELRAEDKMPNFLNMYRIKSIDPEEIKVQIKSLALVIPIIGILIYPLTKKASPNYWTLFISIVLYLITRLKPSILKYIAIIWREINQALGIIKSYTLMLAFYFLVLFPYGLLIKIFYNGFLSIKRDPKKESYFF